MEIWAVNNPFTTWLSFFIVSTVTDMKHFVIFWSILAFVLCGCSNATSPSQKFLKLISTADRLEVTNPEYIRLGVTNSYAAFMITGADVIKLTTAIKSAKHYTPDKAMDWKSPFSWNVEFYSGTNKLGDIAVCYGMFRIEGTECTDRTGVIENFWKKWQADSDKPQ